MDAIVPSALPDADFKDNVPVASSSSSPMSNLSLGSEVTDDTDMDDSSSRVGGAEAELTSPEDQSKSEEERIEEGLLHQLHSTFDAVPSVPLPKVIIIIC